MDILHTLFYTDLNSWSHYIETHTAGSLTSQERPVISPYWWSMDRNNISCWLFKLQFIETWVKPLLKLYSCIFTLSSMYHAAIALAGKKTIVGQKTSYIYIYSSSTYIYMMCTKLLDLESYPPNVPQVESEKRQLQNWPGGWI